MDLDVITLEENTGKSKKNLVKIETKSNSYYDNENIKYFTHDEYSRLLDNAGKYYKCLYLFLYETAARVEEVRAIRYADIDFDRNKVKIKTSKQRNKIKYRILPISDTLKAVLLLHKMENKLEMTDYVLSKSKDKLPPIRQAYDKMLKVDCEDLKIDRDKAHCHTWRHTRAIDLLENGVDIVKLKQFLGHSSIQNTLIYLKYSNRDFDNAIRNANKSIGLL